MSPEATDASGGPAEDVAWTRYLELNRSYRQPFVLHLSRRGFFSEVNVLVDAIIFGLVHRRRLTVRQRRFNDLRWNDYFVARLPEFDRKAWPSDEGSHMRHQSEPFNALLSWAKASSAGTFEIPELGLGGDVMAVKRSVYGMLCRPTADIAAEAQSRLQSNGLVEGRFYAVHVRRGDKVAKRKKNGRMWSEGEDTPVVRYAEAVRARAPGLGDLFVLTDDHGSVEALADPAHGFRVVSLCPDTARGHDQPSFNELALEERRAIVRRLMVETEIAIRSGPFAGGFKSNVARYIATVHRRPELCVSVDSQKNAWGPP